MPMPKPILIGRWWSYASILISETVNELIDYVRLLRDRHDNELRGIRVELLKLSRRVEELEAGLNQPRIEFTIEKAKDKEI